MTRTILGIGALGALLLLTAGPASARRVGPAPSRPTIKWKKCSNEGGICRFAGKTRVRYGAKGKFVVRTMTGPVKCTNRIFGDPIKGTVKACYRAGGIATVAQSQGKRCAPEGRTCQFSGMGTVFYGAKGYFVRKHTKGPVACNNRTFGDPIPGTVKSCFLVSNAPQTPPKNTVKCAREGQRCHFGGNKVVWYGAGQNWVKKNVTNGTACTNAVFGDPIRGTVKTCRVIPPAPVNGWTVKQVRCAGGRPEFAHKGGKQWLQKGSGAPILWTENNRDEWSVYLNEPRTRRNLQLDLWEKKAFMTANRKRRVICAIGSRSNSVGPRRIALLGHHGRYVVAEKDGTANANRPKANTWEQFQLIWNADGSVSLRSFHGKYLVAERDGRANANRAKLGPWEKWRLVQNRDGTVSLRSHHGKFLVAEKDGRLNANRAKIGPWEKFRIKDF